MSKLISLLFAITFSFLVFVGMTYLVAPKELKVEDGVKTEAISITYNDETEGPKTRKYKLPKKPEEIKQPVVVKTAVSKKQRPTRVAFLDVDMLTHKVANGDSLIRFASNMGGTGNAGPSPRVRINPRYPRDAAMNGIEGFVTLSFDITETGNTQNVSVVDAKPKRIFDAAARKAVRKWRYSPKMEGSRAVAQPNQRITLQFNLEAETL